MILDTPITSSVVTHCVSSILADTTCYLKLLRLTICWQECHLELWRRLNCLAHLVQLGLTMPFHHAACYWYMHQGQSATALLMVSLLSSVTSVTISLPQVLS